MINYYDKYRYLSCFEMIEDNESWWIPEYKWNTLFRISKNTMDIQKIVDLTGKVEASEGCYSYIVSYQDKLIFLPQNSLNIAIYDRNLSSLTIFTLDTGKKSGIYGTAGYAMLERKIYVFSSYEDCMPFVLDGETWNIKYLESWISQINKYSKRQKWIINSSVEMDGIIFLGIYGSNLILKYFPEEDKYKEIVLADDYVKINKIYRDTNNKKLIILSINKEIIEFSYENKELFETNRWLSKMEDKDVVNIIQDHENIVLLPRIGRYIEIINRMSGKTWGINIPEEYLLDSQIMLGKYIYGGKINNRIIYLFPFSTKGLICIDIFSKKINLIKLEVNKLILKEKFDAYISYNLNMKKIFDEHKLPLHMFLDICNQTTIISKKKDILIGKYIFDRTIEEGN